MAQNDYDAIKTAFESSKVKDMASLKAAFIRDTNSLEKMAVSLPIYEEIKNNKHIEIASGPFVLEFDKDGNIVNMPEF